MEIQFIPHSGDQKTEERYSTGETRTISYHRYTSPANGWSRTEYYREGGKKAEECYSHSLLIERIEYDKAGNVCAHKIYNQRLGKLVDKPAPAPAIRPNVVIGYNHMGFFFHFLPAISKFLGAKYEEGDLQRAYHEFMNEEEVSNHEKAWCLRGGSMGFTIIFEKQEMIYQWSIHAPDEEAYQRARAFMEKLEGK